MGLGDSRDPIPALYEPGPACPRAGVDEVDVRRQRSEERESVAEQDGDARQHDRIDQACCKERSDRRSAVDVTPWASPCSRSVMHSSRERAAVTRASMAKERLPSTITRLSAYGHSPKVRTFWYVLRPINVVDTGHVLRVPEILGQRRVAASVPFYAVALREPIAPSRRAMNPSRLVAMKTLPVQRRWGISALLRAAGGAARGRRNDLAKEIQDGRRVARP